MARRRNPEEDPKALELYEAFQGRAPREIVDFDPSLKIPTTAICVGEAINILYKSDKLNPTTGEDEGWIDYIHDHHKGVMVYRCDPGADGNVCAVPAWIRDCTQLVWLGQCLGFEYSDPGLSESVQAQATRTGGMPDLYAHPSGKALFVIQSDRTLLAIMWGGRLGVEQRGIVH